MYRSQILKGLCSIWAEGVEFFHPAVAGRRILLPFKTRYCKMRVDFSIRVGYAG
jgi:hypothetical protein